MAGKRETIHIDLTSLTKVGPMGVPGMSSVDSKKTSKRSKKSSDSRGPLVSKGPGISVSNNSGNVRPVRKPGIGENPPPKKKKP